MSPGQNGPDPGFLGRAGPVRNVSARPTLLHTQNIHLVAMQKAVDVGHLGGGHAGDVPRCHREPLRRWGNKPLAGGTRQVSSREKQRGLTKGRDQGTRCSWKDGGRGCCGLRGGGHTFALGGGGGVVSMWQGGAKNANRKDRKLKCKTNAKTCKKCKCKKCKTMQLTRERIGPRQKRPFKKVQMFSPAHSSPVKTFLPMHNMQEHLL